jgi:hypothetical protein
MLFMQRYGEFEIPVDAGTPSSIFRRQGQRQAVVYLPKNMVRRMTGIPPQGG